MALRRWREIGSSTHIAGEKAWAFVPIRVTTEREYLEGNLERQSQTRPCSTAKRVAAAREPTPSLR
jgi:hypothetical protein